MGFRRYKERVDNLEQAVWAGAVLDITCQRCKRTSSNWAWLVYNRRGTKLTNETPMRTPVAGFYCKGCRRKVTVIMVPRQTGDL